MVASKTFVHVVPPSTLRSRSPAGRGAVPVAVEARASGGCARGRSSTGRDQRAVLRVARADVVTVDDGEVTGAAGLVAAAARVVEHPVWPLPVLSSRSSPPAWSYRRRLDRCRRSGSRSRARCTCLVHRTAMSCTRPRCRPGRPACPARSPGTAGPPGGCRCLRRQAQACTARSSGRCRPDRPGSSCTRTFAYSGQPWPEPSVPCRSASTRALGGQREVLGDGLRRRSTATPVSVWLV